MEIEERKKKARKMAEDYVEKSNYVLNPDKKQVEHIIAGLVNNEEKHKFRFCPCRVVEGDIKKDAPKICPCAYHKEEIKKDGYCLCRFFVSKEWAKKNGGN